MTVETSLTLMDPMITILKLKVIPGSFSISIDIGYSSGWNMVGLPIGVEDGSLSAVFPEGTGGTLYSFDVTYVGVDALMPGNGYWLHFPEAGTTTITGTPISSLTLSLTAGWNLFSGISEVTNVNGISDPGGIIVSGTCYGFNEETYVNASILTPGHGYWVNASADGDITISSGGAAKTRSAFTDRTVKANKLSFNGNDLYFGVFIPEEEKLSYQLPPKPPAGAFDIRFVGDWKYCEGFGELDISVSNSDLLDVTYNIKDETQWILHDSNNEFEIRLSGISQITIPNDYSSLILEKARDLLPKTFSLYQNYPNPFNPVTQITYSIPQQSYIVIEIFDLTGAHVKTLVEGKQNSGLQTVQWEGTDKNGILVGTGVYLYRINSNSFSQTKKMVLIK
jgi:hypothetical protein